MKVKGLDGKEYSWILQKKQERQCSSYHEKCRNVLKELYPFDTIIEELTIPGCSTQLYLDFFLPLRRIAIEVQGEQHYKFNAHFYKDKRAFAKALGRDKEKKAFCVLNGFKFLELSYERSREWRSIINGTTSTGDSEKD